MFKYTRTVNFYETDMMSIVHHGNYLRFYEEARVAWARARGLLKNPEDAAQFAVLGTQVKHLKPARFGDELEFVVQAKMEGVRIILEYKMLNRDGAVLLSEARTEHVAIDIASGPVDINGVAAKPKFKLMKPTSAVAAVMEKEPWIETWLSSL